MPERHNWVSRFTGFFLTRRQFSVILFLFVLMGGVTALLGLRREGFPQVPVKIVVINTIYKGTAAAEIEQSITNPLEAAVKDLKTVKSTASTSADSHSSIIITLDEKANADASLQDITTKVSSVELPKEADKPDISQPSTGNSSFIFGLTGNLSDQALLDQGRIFQREVAQVKGIRNVTLQSTFQDRVEVTFDPAKLAASGVDASKISTALAANNLNFPAGQNLTIDGTRATALVVGRDTSLDELGATPLPTLTGGTVKLADIASIKRAINQQGRLNHIGTVENGTPTSHTGIVYGVDIRSDADILDVNTTLTDTLQRLQDKHVLSPSLKLIRLFDDGDATARQINEIKSGAIGEKWQGIGALGYVGYLVGGIWLLMLAMFLFVNLRTALIAGVAIPLSFLFTLISLYIAGITLNTLTLFSMILVLGLVVDPAIVVLESIQRYKDMGRTGREGVMAAISSIGQGLLLATICSIIVFTPFGIVSGVFGQIIRFIPITVIPALIASFFVPLIFLTPLAGQFIKARPLPPGVPHDEEHALWAVSRWFKRANLFILRHVWLQITIILLAVTLPLGITGYLFATGQVKSAQFSKPHDTLQATATVSFPANFTDAQIADLAHQTEAALAQRSEIVSYYYAAQSATSFTIWLNLTPIDERTITSETIAHQLKDQLPHDPTKQIYVTTDTVSAGPPANTFPVQLQIYEADLAKLKTFALAVSDHAKHLPGVTRVSDGYTDVATGAVQITLNKQAAAQHGLNVATVGGQLAGLLGQQELTKVTLGETQLDVIASYQSTDKYNSVTALKAATISTPTGPLSLGQIATFSQADGAGNILHQDGLRYASVRAQLADGVNQYQTQKDLSNWAKNQLSHYGLADTALESKGESDDIAQSFANLFTALGIAILMIYLVLALFFGSFLKPIIITFALPLSFLGVFPTLALLNNEFGFLEILGLITLSGIVVNVGIFVIDYANHRVAEGMDPREAIAQATAVRFRPIFLTKVTALGSLLPLAILSPFWRGLASVIVAGILTSGILSLFTTPILYTWFNGLAKFPSWLGHKLAPKFHK